MLLLAAAAFGCAHGSARDDAPADAYPVTLRLEQMPLAQALAALARAASVELAVKGDVPDVQVADILANVDFRDGLHRLLSGRSYLLIEHAARSPTRETRFEVLFLLCDGEETSASAVAASPAAMAQEESTVEALADKVRLAHSAHTRAAALDALAYRARSSESGSALAERAMDEALADPEEQVRRQALTTLKDTAEEVPVGRLARIAGEDASADVRIQALELLVERATDEAPATVRAALTDPEPAVRERASELMMDWHLDP
jgi:hypothetical protein